MATKKKSGKKSTRKSSKSSGSEKTRKKSAAKKSASGAKRKGTKSRGSKGSPGILTRATKAVTGFFGGAAEDVGQAAKEAVKAPTKTGRAVAKRVSS